MDVESAAPETASSEVDVDALMAETEAPGREIPMDDPAPAPAPAAAPQAQPETYTVKVAGKEYNLTKDQLIQKAQLGWDYAQQMEKIKSEREQYESQFKPYLEIDEFAKQNPDWWNHVQQTWATREGQQTQQSLDPANPVLQELNQLKQELTGIKQFVDQTTQEKLNAQRETEDKKLNTEIQSMREQYSYLDWKSVDERGHDLETRVIAYANQNGIRDFGAAFKAFNHDRLLSIAEERGKEAVTKDIQKKTKLGLLGQGPAPKREVQSTSVKGKTYNDLLNEAMLEVGIGDAS